MEWLKERTYSSVSFKWALFSFFHENMFNRLIDEQKSKRICANAEDFHIEKIKFWFAWKIMKKKSHSTLLLLQKLMLIIKTLTDINDNYTNVIYIYIYIVLT